MRGIDEGQARRRSLVLAGEFEFRKVERDLDERRAARAIDALRSVFEPGKKPEQIATQPAAVAAGEPRSARSIERLGDGIRGRNRL